MSNASVVDSFAIAERIEQELARVRAARPGNQALASRISRAEHILVTHLSCRRQRLIRVRANAGGARFLVKGSGGAVYVVDPASWSCTCPDHHRRGASSACKHSMACYALWRSGLRPAHRVEVLGSTTPAEVQGFEHVGEIIGRAVPMPRQRSCDGCGDRFAERDLIEAGPEQAEWTLTAFEGDELCIPGGCASRHRVL